MSHSLDETTMSLNVSRGEILEIKKKLQMSKKEIIANVDKDYDDEIGELIKRIQEIESKMEKFKD